MNEINDKINIKDTVQQMRGEIIFYDENGNEIYRTHNTIVNDGRKLLNTIFYNAILSPNTTLKNYCENFKINFSYLDGDTVILTTPSLTLEDISSSSATDVLSIDLNNANTTKNVDNICVTFVVTISGSNSFTKYNQLYITFDEPGNGTTKLFSRASLNPTFIGSTAKVTMKYSIYM